MSPLQIVAIVALTGYAIYRQTRQLEVVGSRVCFAAPRRRGRSVRLG